MSADGNYSYLAPRMEGQSIIQRHAALAGGDAGDSISVSMAVCSPGRGPILHAHMNTVEAFLEHPQLHARDRVRKVGSPNGPLTSFLPAISIPGVEPVMGNIPAVGEHTDAILTELGLKETIRT